MKFTLKAPCVNCPFRTDKPELEGWLGADRASKIADSICTGGKTFSCHKTTHHDDDGNYIPSINEIHCAGALIMLEKMGITNDNQMLRIAQRIGIYNPSTLEIDSPVFDDESAFIDLHDGGVN